MGSEAGTGRVFTQYDGKPMNPDTPYSFFKRFCKKHGLRHIKPHSLRHLNATVLINAGIDIKAVQKAMGHSSANTTLNIYVHTFEEANTKAMEVLANALDFNLLGKSENTDIVT